MALPVEDVRRLTWDDIMERPLEFMGGEVTLWRPDIDRNQSRMVTDKVGWNHEMRGRLESAILQVTGTPNRAWQTATPDQETRAALIAHMIHTEEAKNATEQ